MGMNGRPAPDHDLPLGMGSVKGGKKICRLKKSESPNRKGDYAMDTPQWEVCSECGMCEGCGHADDCEEMVDTALLVEKSDA